MAKKSVFDRAAEALETGSSKECAALLTEIDDALTAEAATIEQTQPPGEAVHIGGGRTSGVLPTGPKFAQASVSGDTDAVARVTAEHHAATVRHDTLSGLRGQLQQRHKQLQEQEHVDAAPGRAAELVEQIDALADEHAAAMAAFQEAHDRLRGAVSELVECRKLNRESPGLSIEQFALAGEALAHTLPRRHVETETHGHSHPARDITPLFGNQQVAVRNAKALVDVPEGLVARIGKLLGRRSSVALGRDPDSSDREVRDRLGEWYAKLADLLSKGEVAAARKLGPPTYKRGNPVFDEDAA